MRRPIHDFSGPTSGRGVTLIELLIAISIVAVLTVVAAPSLSGLIWQSRISSQVNDLVGAINLARSEAVKRGTGVTLCRSDDQSSCAVGAAGWETGWIVFSDPNFNATVDNGEILIHAFPALVNGVTATASAGITSSVTFAGTGRPGALFAGASIEICPPSNADYCRYVCINAQGRPKVDTPSAYAADALCGT